ncbi:hypothetical protein DFJ73DRAFT_260952 [Zopfochytrium polystomum]|nr:hypothetical protein DFJ73DRAFT_260952 [Zopfochytrium polystomum]
MCPQQRRQRKRKERTSDQQPVAAVISMPTHDLHTFLPVRVNGAFSQEETGMKRLVQGKELRDFFKGQKQPRKPPMFTDEDINQKSSTLMAEFAKAAETSRKRKHANREESVPRIASDQIYDATQEPERAPATDDCVTVLNEQTPDQHPQPESAQGTFSGVEFITGSMPEISHPPRKSRTHRERVST